MKNRPVLAVIGGSGLYEMPGLQDTTQHDIDTPFGKPSAPIIVGSLDGKIVAFLARHGIGHTISPTEVNSRANIYALKTLGIKHVVSISACGSLREDYAPGHIVIPDQVFDFTRDRKRSFFEEGHVAHVSVAEPFCLELGKLVYQSVEKTGAIVHNGGTYITIEGPRFSTRAESNVYRSWGMSIIGMTTSPEAFLAREAEMCYAVMAHVTDYDVWHISEEPVTAEIVIRVLHQNTETAQQSIRNLVQILDPDRDCEHHHALETAFITNPSAISAEARQRLKLLTEKYQS
jgi:5'-methylthioadenosine phosphorylase